MDSGPEKPAASVQPHALHVGSRSIQKPSRRARIISEWWYTEIACMLMAVIVFGLYCRILRVWHLKRDDDWPKMRFANNLQGAASGIIKLLQVLIFIPVAAAMGQLKWHHFLGSTSRPVADMQTFDAASRGISGSIRLITSKHRFHSVHITLGCILFISTLLLSLLTQNAIDVEQRADPSFKTSSDFDDLDSQGTIKLFSSLVDIGSPSYVVVDEDSLFIDARLEAALSVAWFYPMNPQNEFERFDPLPMNCTAPACQWDNYTTLEIQWVCKDLPTAIDSAGFGYSDQANITNAVSSPDGSTPIHARLNSKTSPTIPPNSTFNTYLPDPATLILHFAAIAVHNPLRFETVECIMFWHVLHYPLHSYNSTGKNHTLDNEQAPKLVNVTEKDDTLSTDAITFKAPCNARNDTCSYTVTNKSTIELQRLLSDFFDGFVYGNDSRSSSNLESSRNSIRMFSQTWIDHNLSHALPLHFTLRLYVAVMALGIKGYIQATSAEENVGKALGNHIYYVVKWPFVAYPATILALSIYLFLFTMWRTRHMPAWKTSLLPFLYHGFESPVYEEGSPLSNLAWMEQASKGKKVVLRDDNDGLGLRLRDS